MIMVPTNTSPATKALELQQHKMTVSRGTIRQVNIDSKLTHDFFNLNFEEEDVNAFPVIEWDLNEDSDSDSSSVRSMDSWSSVLADFDCSLGKRERCTSKTSRRLVRSKKIKSDLSSLARGISAGTA
uniref:Uncharacterized protein n=1 Tax=Pseudo-nitzschia australis TaxID=44445 RepID=A0A7S4ER25_9STRA|mmetsp:Transcript_20009/g.43520  ORF Transcript_20009/g.43520 Transcript_20009/m.43520 type:complete len:127 (+) Transcript_20009:136-516(+)|eukprot:CAMPEP_0168170132 /NCGR_PEP_ID=MMETSP0139_2-20121125/4011_1 /TAXON_ID=44445 /ORGANISM="Pseudo-nitzschia australis, Strain 10249 10 AB" /LENGTH=126 /DNA_ID=CAMNT_0008087603 /DNA_START=278 /DNA_END=658 /DNA_ORIENTATION=-